MERMRCRDAAPSSHGNSWRRWDARGGSKGVVDYIRVSLWGPREADK